MQEPVLPVCCNVGDRLLEAASIAAAKAAEAAEATRQRMQSAENAQAASGSPSMQAGPSNAVVNTPPTKPARNKRYNQPNAPMYLDPQCHLRIACMKCSSGPSINKPCMHLCTDMHAVVDHQEGPTLAVTQPQLDAAAGKA